MWQIMAAVRLKRHCSAKRHRKSKEREKISKVAPVNAMKAYRGIEVHLHHS
jgi:hypothetical protein